MGVSDERKAYQKAWTKANHEKALQYQRDYYKRNKEKIRAENRERYKKHKIPRQVKEGFNASDLMNQYMTGDKLWRVLTDIINERSWYVG